MQKGQNAKVTKRIVRAHKEGFVSHYARYEFDAKYRRDCIDNDVAKELYVRRYDKKSRRDWFEPAESFVITEEVRQNKGRIIGGVVRSAVRKDDEEPEATWEPTPRGRALLAQSDQPFNLRENPSAISGGSSSHRERSERRRRSPATRHKAGKEPPYKRNR